MLVIRPPAEINSIRNMFRMIRIDPHEEINAFLGDVQGRAFDNVTAYIDLWQEIDRVLPGFDTAPLVRAPLQGFIDLYRETLSSRVRSYVFDTMAECDRLRLTALMGAMFGQPFRTPHNTLHGLPYNALYDLTAWAVHLDVERKMARVGDWPPRSAFRLVRAQTIRVAFSVRLPTVDLSTPGSYVEVARWVRAAVASRSDDYNWPAWGPGSLYSTVIRAEGCVRVPCKIVEAMEILTDPLETALDVWPLDHCSAVGLWIQRDKDTDHNTSLTTKGGTP